MHRYILRATRRFFGSTNVPRAGKRDAAGKARPRRASEGYDHVTWKRQSNTSFVQLQIVNALRRGDREGASKMLSNYVHVNHTLSLKDFTHIVEYCAQAPDPLFGIETWKVLEEGGINVNKGSCRSIIQAYIKRGYLNKALNWLSVLGEGDSGGAVLPLFNSVLNKCVGKRRLNEAEQCLDLMERRLIGKSEATYRELLELAVLQKNLTAVHEIWKDCTRYYNPSIKTLQKLFWSLTRLGDIRSAYIVLQHMVILAKQRSASLTKPSFQSTKLDIPVPAINGLSETLFSLKSGVSFLSPLEQGSLGTEESLGDLDVLCGEKRSLNHVTEKLNFETIPGNRTQVPGAADVIFCPTLERQFSDEVDKVRETSVFSLAKQEMRKASVRDQTFLGGPFTDLLLACARLKTYKLAEKLFLQMHDLGLEPSRRAYDGFVKAVIDGKGAAYGMKLVGLMLKRNINPSNGTLAALSIAQSKNLNLMLAETLLGRISDNLPKYIHVFNALLAACHVMDEPERAVRVVAKMKHSNIKPNITTYGHMFSLFGTVNVPYEKGNMLSHIDVAKRVNIIEMDMMNNGIQHGFVSMKKLIGALAAEGMMQEMLQHLDVAESMLWMMNPGQISELYTRVLHALVKSKDTCAAIRVFKNMRLHALPADIVIYNIMIECCSILTCFRSASALVSLMYRDGFPPNLLTYNALVKVLIADENFDGALNYLEQLRIDGIKPDTQIFNTTLREAYFKGRINVIEPIIEHMHKHMIQPDPSTVAYTFCAYVEHGFHNTAMEALQVLSLRMISEEDSILQEMRASFEDLIHDEDPDAELKIIETFKASQEYLATALLNLRWCAIAGFSISWSPAESLWAKRLSSSYGVGKR